MPSRLLPLAVSLGLNVAIVGVFLARPSLAPTALRTTFQLGRADTNAALAATTPPPAPKPAAPSKLWPMLATEDTATLITRLRTAGFPAAVIREIVMADLQSRYEKRLRTLMEGDGSAPYWRPPSAMLRVGSPQLEEYYRLQRERGKLQRELLGDPFFANDDVTVAQRRQFGNLTQQKIDVVQQIEDDYADMIAAIRGSTNGILLPEDREKLAFLAKEKKADLARVLTTDELSDYEVRSSPITRLMIGQLGEFRPSESEFRALFQVQQALNDKFPGMMTAGNYTERRDYQQQLHQDLRAKLGDARFNDYARETSNDYQQLKRLLQRDNLPADIGQRAYDVRNMVSQESMKIFNDASLSPEDKRSMMSTVAQNARAQILTLLGPSAGPAYVKTLDSSWLNLVERGIAVTFDGGASRMSGSNDVMVSVGVGPNFHSAPRPPPAP